MAPRPSWKGFLRLSLVSVPVKAFTATKTSGEVRLNQLHKETHQRIKYQKTVPDIGPVAADDIVSGYEYAKGQYVVIDPDELNKLRKPSDHSINISGFVGASDVDSVFFGGRTYYLLPDGNAGNKPYKLLHEAMLRDELCALAQVVLSGREQLVLVRVIGKMLAMTVLTHADKVKAAGEFEDEVPDIAISEDELKLTKTLIDASMIEDLDYASYEDEYVVKLRQLIDLKVAGKQVVQATESEEPQIINFMEALKQSVAEAQAAPKTDPKADGKGAAKKMAPSKKRAGNSKKKAANKSG